MRGMTSVNPGPDAVTEAARREEDEVDVTERDVASDDIKKILTNL